MWTPWSIRKECREAQDICRRAIACIERSARTTEDLFALNRDLSNQLAAARARLASEQLIPVSTVPTIGEQMQAGDVQSDEAFLHGIGIEPL